MNIIQILKANGVSGDNLSIIESEIKQEIGKSFVDKEQYNSKVAELKTATSEIEKLKTTSEELTTMKKKLTDKETEFAEFKSDIEKQKTINVKKQALIKALAAEKANPDAVELLLQAFDLDKITINDKGEIDKVADVIKPIKESKPSLFGVTVQNPTKSGEKLPITGNIQSADFEKMDFATKIKLKEEQPTVYESLMKSMTT